MPRPLLPRAEQIAGIAKALRAEGFASFCIETMPDGRVAISAGQAGAAEQMTPLEEWRAKRDAAKGRP